MQKNEPTPVVYGRHPVVSAIQSGREIEKVFLQRGVQTAFEKEIQQLCRTHSCPLQLVPKEKLNRLTRDNNHQGIVAVLSLVSYQSLEDILKKTEVRSSHPLFLLLDGITDVRNIGAIARSAECLGVDALILPGKQGGQLNADAVKTSAGALLKIPVCRVASMPRAIEDLQMADVRVMASTLQASKQIGEVDFNGPLAILIGSEGKGVNPSLLRLVDEQFTIPQVGETDSLNVSVATGIMLYECQRQRQK